MDKIKVGIIGATGMVGQNYLRLLADHPLFEVSFLAASSKSAGKNYSAAVAGRSTEALPPIYDSMPVHDARDLANAKKHCRLVFSALSLEKQAIKDLEKSYAAEGCAVVSNNSAFREDPLVPMIIPEVNPEHLKLIGQQRSHFGWDSGLIVTKPNCGIQSYMLPLDAFRKAGYQVRKLNTTNLQALSGAGYQGPAALDLVDNLLHLPTEESKGSSEPQKLFGSISEQGIISKQDLAVSSHCVRVPVLHGHMSCISIGFEGKKPGLEEAAEILRNYASTPQKLALPSAPQPAICYIDSDQRPQPRRDRDAGSGMAVTVGRIKPCSILDLSFACLSHNTVRGAAGGAVLMAELLAAKGYL